MRETCIKENMAERTGYSNPAKLMNYIKMKKSQSNSNFYSGTIPNYVSHIDAYKLLQVKQSQEQKENQKKLLEQIKKRKFQNQFES